MVAANMCHAIVLDGARKLFDSEFEQEARISRAGQFSGSRRKSFNDIGAVDPISCDGKPTTLVFKQEGGGRVLIICFRWAKCPTCYAGCVCEVGDRCGVDMPF